MFKKHKRVFKKCFLLHVHTKGERSSFKDNRIKSNSKNNNNS
jgi:hypothetical protein